MFFVLTTGRSGSKSIANYLSSSNDIMCLHEPNPILIEEAPQYLYKNYSHEKLVQLLRKTRKPIVNGLQYGESNQKLSFIIPAIVEAFPECKFIWLVRDGREVVNSAYSLGWYDNNLLKNSKWQNNLIQAPNTGDIEKNQWDKMNSFEKCCWYWGYTNKLIKTHLNLIDEKKWLLVKIEDIKYDKIFKFLDAKPSEHKVPWVNKKRKLKENESWQNWTGEQKNIFKEICGREMDELYPNWITANGKWCELLHIPVTTKIKHYFQNILVKVPGKKSILYRTVKYMCDLIFRKKSPLILRRLDKIYRKLSGEE